MMRVRLKADGRIVEILPDGSEQALSTRLEAILAQAAPRDPAIDSQADPAPSEARDAVYARGVRARTKLKLKRTNSSSKNCSKTRFPRKIANKHSKTSCA